jgi:hypothetical protein
MTELDRIEAELADRLLQPQTKENKERIEYLGKLRTYLRPSVLRQSVDSNRYEGRRIEEFNRQ